MTTFDAERIYYTDQKFRVDEFTEDTKSDAQKKAARFLREFTHMDSFVYRDQIRQHASKQYYVVQVEINDIQSFDLGLYQFIQERPYEIQAVFEKAIKDLYSQDTGMLREECPDFQLQVISHQTPAQLRNLNPTLIGHLVTVKCIVIASKSIRVKAKAVVAACRECGDKQFFDLGYGYSPINLPRICLSRPQKQNNPGERQCPADPYVILPEECSFIDQQTLRIQELSEAIPPGDVPRNFMGYCDRYLVNRLIPGRVAVITGIYVVPPRKAVKARSNAIESELLQPYIHILGAKTEQLDKFQHLEPHIQQEFKELGKNASIYKIIKNSIAPAIYGQDDVKLAIACLLFGGTTKYLPDGMKLRGDINVLLIGDPSTAKSQLLKFVERAADISVYTSGKGSSAAGLTATITYQQNTSQFTLEAGALVIASGGVCCIDEFDKMRPEDRVAMHEAMEQQTISIAKAGITTRLNARCSILAAANPIFGRYQENKSIQEQIELQTTILSRFDNIFIIKDNRSIESDTRMATHILQLHTGHFAEQEAMQVEEEQLPLEKLRLYIRYARQSCKPLLSEKAAILVQNLYVEDRQKSSEQGHHKAHGGKSHIPITVRQLEAIIRLSEALAKMQLSELVSERHVKEAHRLFQNSTMMAVSLGAKEFGLDLSNEMRQLVQQIEESIMRRIHLGSKIPQQKLMDELVQRFNNQRAVEFAIHQLIQTEVLQQIEQKKMLIRKK